jgi:predicted CopG family antitoxin
VAKQLNVILDDEDHRKLLKAKGERSWREFIMTLIQK